MALLNPTELRELEALGRQLRFGTASGEQGPHSSVAKGGQSEFSDRRAYTPGDDPRTIDWLAYARTRQVVVKRFAAEEGSLVRLLMDCSLSMGLGEPSKLLTAQRVAAGIGYVALASGARVQLFRSDESGRLHVSRPRRGRANLGQLLSDIEACKSEGSTALGNWLYSITATRRRGSMIILSDFLQDAHLPRLLSRARAGGCQVALVQVLANEDVRPAAQGNTTLIGVEGEGRLDLPLDEATLLAYERCLGEHLAALSTWARSEGQTYLRLSCGADVVTTVARFARGAVDRP